jgi:hypothetical protein
MSTRGIASIVGVTYDAARHTYLDNVVVLARLEAVRGAGS